MQRRHFIAAAGVGIAGTLARSAVAADPPSKSAHGSAMQECAAECYDCAQECDSCSAHCAGLVSKGKSDHMATMQSCLDCADICRAAGALSARSSKYASLVCKACAEVCDACAAACEKQPDDEHMKKCAKACRDCAKECREMLTHAAHA
jgi:hypothetical protein